MPGKRSQAKRAGRGPRSPELLKSQAASVARSSPTRRHADSSQVPGSRYHSPHPPQWNSASGPHTSGSAPPPTPPTARGTRGKKGHPSTPSSADGSPSPILPPTSAYMVERKRRFAARFPRSATAAVPSEPELYDRFADLLRRCQAQLRQAQSLKQQVFDTTYKHALKLRLSATNDASPLRQCYHPTCTMTFGTPLDLQVHLLGHHGSYIEGVLDTFASQNTAFREGFAQCEALEAQLRVASASLDQLRLSLLDSMKTNFVVNMEAMYRGNPKYTLPSPAAPMSPHSAAASALSHGPLVPSQ